MIGLAYSGSWVLIMLLTYWSLGEQSGFWAAGYLLLVILVLASMAVLRSRTAGAVVIAPPPADDDCAGAALPAGERARWFFLSMIPAGLMYAVTSTITQDLASVPLLWILPLSIYLLSFILGFFGLRMSFIYSSGIIGIGFSVFVVVIAALNLVLDFDFIEKGAENGVPKYMEWYGAFGLIVTLIWLYFEILRLLSKLRNR